MAKGTFRLTIVSPAKTIYEGDLVSMIVPGRMGYIGILPNHAPIITQLSPGNIRLRDTSGSIKTFSSDTDGFLEVSDNKATMLLDKEIA